MAYLPYKGTEAWSARDPMESKALQAVDIDAASLQFLSEPAAWLINLVDQMAMDSGTLQGQNEHPE